MNTAACEKHDPEMWFPFKRGPNDRAYFRAVEEAKAICQTCPVRAECLAVALEEDHRDGIWGGLTERERIKGGAA